MSKKDRPDSTVDESLRFLRPEEAAHKLGITLEELYKYVDDGYINMHRFGKKIKRFRLQEIRQISVNEIKEKYIERSENKPEKESGSINRGKPKPLGVVYFIGTFDKIYSPTPIHKMDGKLYNVVKIGFTTKIKNRLTKIQTASFCHMFLLAAIDDVTSDIEKNIHKRYSSQWIRGEWFYWRRHMSDGLFHKIEKHKIDNRNTYRRILRKWS